jgi:hypothetical protein
MLGQTELSIYGEILNVQKQVTCLLVKYYRLIGTSSLEMISKETLMITLIVSRLAAGGRNINKVANICRNELFPSRGKYS